MSIRRCIFNLDLLAISEMFSSPISAMILKILTLPFEEKTSSIDIGDSPTSVQNRLGHRLL